MGRLLWRPARGEEAVVKALGTGFSGDVAWTDVEIVKEMRVPLAIVRQHLTALAESREAIVCKTI